MRINIKIDQLVIDGFDYNDTHGISTSIERELARLFAADSESSSAGAGRSRGDLYEKYVQDHTIKQIDAGSFDVKDTATSDMIGSQAAKAVYQRLVR